MAKERMIIHDTRLLGTAPAIAQNIYTVNGTTSIQHALGWVGQHARDVHGLDELLIMCHGFEADWDLANQMCTGREVGGFGLSLCREGLTLSNVILTTNWNHNIKRIIVYACAPAATGPGNEGTWGDGKRLMGEMALWSGAEVIASDTTQIYTYGGSANAPIDFGQWEGTVYRFSPDTGYGEPVSLGPMS